VSGELIIRKYQNSDRQAVRDLCYDTGMMGQSVSYLWADKESFSDMFTMYYTDKEPESSFVAEFNGKVIGYLNGCVDSKRAYNPVKIASRHVVKRGIIFNKVTGPTILRVVTEGLFMQIKGADFDNAPFRDPRWPAHLHINVKKEFRHQNAGSKLIKAYFEYLKSKNITGCFLETLYENKNAIAFFEKMGFTKHKGPIPIPGWRDPSGKKLNGLVMVTEL
jgi:ribosomal protein S18 acetylase RimI-like enzyme